MKYSLSIRFHLLSRKFKGKEGMEDCGTQAKRHKDKSGRVY